MSTISLITRVLERFAAGQEALAAGITCQAIQGGAVNTITRVTSARHDWAVRLAGAVDDSLSVSRVGEYRAQSAAAALGLAPAVAYADPEQGVLVSDWISAPLAAYDVFQTVDGLARVGRQLRVLHDAPVPPGLRVVNPLVVAHDYLRGPRVGSGPLSREALEAALARVADLRLCEELSFCHNDLHHLNVLDNGQLWFIDWEYAGAGDPRFDLAGIVAYHDLDARQITALLGAHGRFDPRDILPWVTLFDVIHALWLDTADAWASLPAPRVAALSTRLTG